jgi:hypothetical protein
VGEKYHFLLNTTKFMEIVIDKISHKILVFFFENPKQAVKNGSKKKNIYIYIANLPSHPIFLLVGSVVTDVARIFKTLPKVKP